MRNLMMLRLAACLCGEAALSLAFSPQHAPPLAWKGTRMLTSCSVHRLSPLAHLLPGGPPLSPRAGGQQRQREQRPMCVSQGGQGSISAEEVAESVVRASDRMAKTGILRRTPLENSPWLSDIGSCAVSLKLEGEQVTGSFKARGALNKMLCLDASQQVVTASSGNHGMATAHVLSKLGREGLVFLPENASPGKVAALGRFPGMQVRFHGSVENIEETEAFARRHAETEGLQFVSPYNDADVIAGQGTVGLEMLEQLVEERGGGRGFDAIFVTCGGGGLISGVASYIKERCPGCVVYGCLPVNSPVMAKCVEAGEIIEWESSETLSDGSAGGVEPGSLTFPLCRDLVDRWVLVGEGEIELAVAGMLQEHHKVAEGAAGVAVAAYQKVAREEGAVLRGKEVGIVLCGSNIGGGAVKRCLEAAGL